MKIMPDNCDVCSDCVRRYIDPKPDNRTLYYYICISGFDPYPVVCTICKRTIFTNCYAFDLERKRWV